MLKWLKETLGGGAPSRTASSSEDEETISLEEAKAKLAPHRRTTYHPLVLEEAGPLRASKLGGIPWLEEDGAWPVCPSCNGAMQFFVQLSLAELPARPAGCPDHGLVQVFYCTNDEPNCEVDLEGWAPFSKVSVCRLIREPGDGFAYPESPVKGAFEERHIVDWEADDDFPNWEEGEALGIDYNDALAETLSDADYPRGGEKLLGWPCWIQGVEYPDCPDCGETMTLLFQIDTEGNLPWMWGDSGCAHVTMCKSHPERVAIGWACS